VRTVPGARLSLEPPLAKKAGFSGRIYDFSACI
jgi:hypothetical protein